MYRLEYHISYSCVNNCIFCSENDQLNIFKNQFVALKTIRSSLQKFASIKGEFRHVTFTGGEPTLHPDFVSLVSIAKDLGYRTSLTTNGGLFRLKSFSRCALPYLDEICFSIAGHNARMHNFHTRNSKSFDGLIRALENIEAFDKDIYGLINVVVTKYNLMGLEKIMRLVSHFKKIKHILFSNLAPEGAGLTNYKLLTVTLSEFKKYIPQIAALNKNKSVIRFFGLPLCVFGENLDFSNDIHWTPRVTIEKAREDNLVILKKTTSFKPVRKRLKTNACRVCLLNNECSGVFKEYYKTFGDSELSPILRIAHD